MRIAIIEDNDTYREIDTGPLQANDIYSDEEIEVVNNATALARQNNCPGPVVVFTDTDSRGILRGITIDEDYERAGDNVTNEGILMYADAVNHTFAHENGHLLMDGTVNDQAQTWTPPDVDNLMHHPVTGTELTEPQVRDARDSPYVSPE